MMRFRSLCVAAAACILRASRAPCGHNDALRRRTAIATASMCSFEKRYTRMRLRSLFVAAAGRTHHANTKN
eukprot:10081937-Lingulodinium_polyedra.AAC.1